MQAKFVIMNELNCLPLTFKRSFTLFLLRGTTESSSSDMIVTIYLMCKNNFADRHKDTIETYKTPRSRNFEG